MKFKIGDVIECSGTKYRIHTIIRDPLRYKMICLANQSIMDLLEINEGGWNITTPPENETLYNVGQVLIKIVGSPRIGLIVAIRPSSQKDFHVYDMNVFTPNGALIMTTTLLQKELVKDWLIKDLKWVVLYGNPKKTIDLFLKSNIEKLEGELSTQKMLLEHLEFFKSERYN